MVDKFIRYTTVLHTGNPAPYLYTPTSLLPEHSVLTDVQQATGRNGQQSITCRSRGQGTRPKIWMGSKLVLSNSTANSATIGLTILSSNGLYHCLSARSQREYFSLYLSNSGKHIAHLRVILSPVYRMWNTQNVQHLPDVNLCMMYCMASYMVYVSCMY